MNKTILILGASGGLGKELTTYFKQGNYNLALHYNTSKLESTSATIKTYSANLKVEEEVVNLVAKVKSDFGRIDVVINIAGISKNNISWKTSLTEWQETLEVNLTAPFLLTKHVLPIMRENGFGRIIYMSSIVAQTGMAGTASYASSKAGLFGLTKTVAKEVAGKNITVNAIALGYFNAGMINDVPEELKQEIVSKIPINRLGDPKELHHLINFLISDDAGYCTGQTLNLNGGLYV